ncbi:MAG: sensor signal transduction histidine kinase [Firmicutes bacterium]|nr:sensor signal transduction histidine kinase [Bacillota bacterium]
MIEVFDLIVSISALMTFHLLETVATMAIIILFFLLHFSMTISPRKWGINFLELSLFALLTGIAIIPTWVTDGQLTLRAIPVLLAPLHTGLRESILVVLFSTAIMLALSNSTIFFWPITGTMIALLGSFVVHRSSQNNIRHKIILLFLLNALYFINYYYGAVAVYGSTFIMPPDDIPIPIGYIAVFLTVMNTIGTIFLDQLIAHFKNHRQLTSQIAHAEEKYRNLVENALVGIYIVQNNKLVYVNPGVSAITGVSNQFLLDIDNIFDYIHPDDHSNVRKNIREMLSGTTERNSYELRLVKDNRCVYVEVFSNYITYEGKPAYIGSMVDITARRQSEVEIRQQQKRLRGIIAAIPDVVTVIDKKGILREILSHRETLSPLSANPVLGQSIYDIVPEPLAGQIMQNIHAALYSQNVVSYSFTFTTVDNRIWNIRLSPINADEVVSTIRDVTKTKKIEDNYRLSMEKFQTLFNSSNDAVFVFPAIRSENTAFLEVNEAACKKLGYTREELLNLPVHAITELPSEELAKNEWDKLMLTGHSIFELVHVAKDGRRILVEANSHLFNLWDSPKVITIARDITARKQIELALRESDARFRYLARHIPLMLWMDDQNGNCIFTNQKWQEFTGISPDEGTKLNWSNHVHPSDKQLIESTLQSALDRQAPFTYEFRMLRYDGEYRWVQAVGIPRRNADNSFAGYIGCCLDIHDKKHAENVLTNSYRRLEKDVEAQSRLLANSNAKLAQEIFVRRAMEKRYRKLFDSVQDAIFVWKITPNGLPGRIIEVNDVACQWLKYTRDELLALTMLSVMPNHGSAFASDRMEKLLASRQAIFEFDYITKDNHHVPAEINAHLFALNGELVGLCIARDISDRKQAELDLLAARNRINKADKLAFLGNMAAGIAHEINQPLNSIKVTADSILMWFKSGQPYQKEEFLEDVQTISQQATRIANIIKYIRDLIRSHQQTTSQRFNMAQAITNAVNMLTPQLNAAKVSLTLDLEDKTLEVNGSLVHMEHVILNLINNALESLESTQQAKRKITIQTRLEDRIIVLISDNGPGIPETIKDKLFTPFFTTKGTGMGLGLSIVKSVITSHGGQITVTNNKPCGAVFRLAFPLIDENNIETISDTNTEDTVEDITKEDNAS